jgi:hypothetical protein
MTRHFILFRILKITNPTEKVRNERKEDPIKSEIMKGRMNINMIKSGIFHDRYLKSNKCFYF